ncbi:3-phosphoserine/phosphohydroxythreonine transaminase [Sediminispirochaeta smaragdinae]|uniref:Phosphoserine aminotransferase n=1 Tax=Sediminispirochaeta smaragdinae (strain DSM 11293 / JCM 15392 / SEBR 4228) TaxID=573413 RepID=E1R371_SEDSS|nr:3-phosphoserine/phosphohydroxythreonine transaminase [Sediminispirochaeta smaragdinae]ADK81257.1 phosphoserine aminotransferase [Sediminispirochaeta smaragdinae DSM 11293]
MSRKLNFYAGPSVLPVEVLEELQANIVDYQGNGFSLIEASHRGKVYDKVHNEAIALIKELMGISDDYSVIFLGGGATLQFSMVPMNFLVDGKVGDYTLTGTWAKKAYTDAEKIGKVHAVFDGKDKNYTTLPEASSVKPSANSAYLHLTSNETIGGLEWKHWPETGDVPLIADMSSDILSRPVPVDKFAMIYAGAQKNLGPAGATIAIIRNDLLERCGDHLTAYLNYKTHTKSNALYNTPPVFSIWGIKLVLEWIKKTGGAEAMAKRAEKKSALLYGTMAESNGFYRCPVDEKYRSTMNVVFRLPNEELEAKFLKESEEAGMLGLKGHRSVGGCRASIYNSLPEDAVSTLAQFMKEFQRKNG